MYFNWQSKNDLNLRGPGDFFGSKQSGLPDFKVADIVHDYRALEVARRDAVRFVEDRLLWENPEYENLFTFMKRKGYFELIDGQQRITTLMILMNVLVKDFPNINKNSDEIENAKQ